MDSAFIRRLSPRNRLFRDRPRSVFDASRMVWGRLAHLLCMDTERTAELGLEPLLTTSELADYLGVRVQAIYDLRCDGRGPVAIHVGRELRYRTTDVRSWLQAMQESAQSSGANAIGGRR
jgi:predicted DNA-binding transcriptional regulator AlpA